MTGPEAGIVPWHARLRSRTGSASPELQSDGTVRLQGEREWRFEGTPSETSLLTASLPGMAERLSDSLVLLSFGNAVGFFDLPGLGRLEVVSGKWDDRHYDAMLRELTEIAVNLPFSSGDTSALPYDRSVAAREDVLYHAFVYLRQVLLGASAPDEQLLPALQLVLRDPHRRFTRTEQTVPLSAARQVSGRGLARLVSGAGGMSRVGSTPREFPLARALRGHLPDRVDESSVVSSVDVPENRFAKAFLGLCMGTIEGMRAAIETPQNVFQRRILTECERMEGLLTPILRHSLWDQVGRMVHFPGSSTVLQRRRGYRTLLKHWIYLRMATRIPLSPERVRGLLEVKDIAELYELWSFFSIVEALGRRLGPPLAARRYEVGAMQASVRWDMEVRWPGGTRALYNPRFSRSRAGIRHSYSVPLRPDIAVEIPGVDGPELHLLDAKFKLDKLASFLPSDDDDDEHAEQVSGERRGSFKRGDIYKMHTYRDALVNARSVWILYPGTEFSFFSASDSSSYREPAGFSEVPDGVGAIPLRPADPDQRALDAVLGAMHHGRI